jgi:hypothetical protein
VLELLGISRDAGMRVEDGCDPDRSMLT